jgi:NAD(P)-dependent dehydrogenase (short-subunit alcohol dehydrogenase family)
MTLYRARPTDGVAWITGASTGIGRQLALDLAAEGYVVAATARGEDQLDEVARMAASLKGRILPVPCDVTDAAAMEQALERIEKELGPVVLAVFNAGSYQPTHGDRLEVGNFEATYRVNLMGVINGLVPVVGRMQRRGYGQIAVVGSATAYYGLPAAAAYGSSKAALNSLAQSLKFDFDRLNIRLQVINPGFVDTPQTKKNKFRMPALMPVEKASERIAAGLRTGGFEVTFPRRLTWVLKVATCLPQPLYHWLVRRATGWDKRRLGPRSQP